jgi:fused signal recognition particle receptor
VDFTSHRPFVVLIVGVNGSGKTTSVGKLAAQQTAAGRKVYLAAGDTFRAAAVEQLEEWGRRAGAQVVKGKEGGDPSAVIFDAIKRAQQDGADVVIADTAGRLHVKEHLMEELQKVRRVIKKADPTAPHETWLVVDATNGQNAIAQATTFKEAIEVTGIILTKLDGTAKGGVILGICNELKLPVRYIGIGEKVNDLRPFDAAQFVDALYDRTAA